MPALDVCTCDGLEPTDTSSWGALAWALDDALEHAGLLPRSLVAVTYEYAHEVHAMFDFSGHVHAALYAISCTLPGVGTRPRDGTYVLPAGVPNNGEMQDMRRTAGSVGVISVTGAQTARWYAYTITPEQTANLAASCNSAVAVDLFDWARPNVAPSVDVVLPWSKARGTDSWPQPINLIVQALGDRLAIAWYWRGLSGMARHCVGDRFGGAYM